VSNEETTAIVSRRIKPGRERDYADWFGRIVEAIKKAPGFKGVTVIVPEDSDSRIVLYRFANAQAMEDWENSTERKALMSEVNKYATQAYDRAGGLETFFHVKDAKSA
jgi:antibiotic biosynthesis monooxygenase (ABM) superfamily enzyme